MLTKICFGLLSRVVNISTFVTGGEVAMLGALLYHIIYCIQNNMLLIGFKYDLKLKHLRTYLENLFPHILP